MSDFTFIKAFAAKQLRICNSFDLGKKLKYRACPWI